MKKLTRKQRLDALSNGFYRCGYIEIEDVEGFLSNPSAFIGLLTEKFADSVREHNELLKISEIRSKDFIDSAGVYCDYKGKTYQHGQFLMHIYPSGRGKNGTASISLLV